jgi:hypothetical protein
VGTAMLDHVPEFHIRQEVVVDRHEEAGTTDSKIIEIFAREIIVLIAIEEVVAVVVDSIPTVDVVTLVHLLEVHQDGNRHVRYPTKLMGQ